MAGTMKYFYMKKYFFPQRREFVLFLPSNMAAMQTLHLSFPDVNKNNGVAETAPVGSVQTFVGSGFVSSSTGPVSK